jgi:hypothetical protein
MAARVPRPALAAALLLAALAIHPTAQSPARLVAMGDIHGADAAFDRLLVRTGLSDAAGKWTGGGTAFVQTGDYTDRGAGTRRVLDRLMAIESQARRGDGRAVILLGNHEVMNILRTFTDVTPEIFATFADSRSERRRQQAYDEQMDLARRTEVPGLAASREAWMEAHPPGYVEYVEAFARNGQYGKWLRERDTAAAVNGMIFMHAGLPPDSELDVDGVHRTVRDLLRAWDRPSEAMVRARLIRPFFTLQETVAAAITELNRISDALKAAEPPGDHVTQDFVNLLLGVASLGTSALLAEKGPLWYRGLTSPTTEVTEPQVAALLTRLGASRFVLGHTPQLPGRITPRFGGRVIAIDTGMLAEYYRGGRPSALVVEGGRLTAVYLDGEETLDVAGR